jgi:hypothetical protein
VDRGYRRGERTEVPVQVACVVDELVLSINSLPSRQGPLVTSVGKMNGERVNGQPMRYRRGCVFGGTVRLVVTGLEVRVRVEASAGESCAR